MAQDASIPTTHIGSLPRPAALLERLEDAGTGEIDDDALRDDLVEAVENVLTRQAGAGLDIVNNGEQGRTGFHIHVLDRLTGFDGEGVAPFWSDVREFPGLAETEFQYPDADPDTGAPIRPAVTGPITYDGEGAANQEIEIFQTALESVDAEFESTFMTAPAPGIVATSLPNQYYETHDEYLSAVAEALKTEYELIAEAGLELQIDAPDLLHTYHREFHDGRGLTFDSPSEYRPVLRTHVEAINTAIESIPSDRIRLHTCWGNYEGPHHLDFPLSEALPELYELDVGTLAVELAGGRHEHEFDTFTDHPLPDGVTLMPGVIDVKTNTIEHPSVVADRLERAASAVGDPTRLVAGPNCGFGTLAWSSAAEEIAWAKLESLVEGTKLAESRLLP